MNDLLDNFANQGLDSPTEEDYKYHFVDGSPAGSQHETSIDLTATALPRPSNEDPFFSIDSHQDISDENEDERYYNADIDEDDDELRRGEASLDEASPDEAYRKKPTNKASYPSKPPFETDKDLNQFIHGPDHGAFPTYGANSREVYSNVESSLAVSDDEKNGLNGFAQHLRRLHRQDIERDELLKVRALPSARLLMTNPSQHVFFSVLKPADYAQ